MKRPEETPEKSPEAERENPYTGVHHAAFATADMAATLGFWRDLLGMRLLLVSGRPESRQYFFEIDRHSRISFFDWPEVEKIPCKRHGEAVRGAFVFDHIAIGVRDKEALWHLMAQLDGAGFPVSDVIDHGCFYSIYSFDPNGIPIEFSCDHPDHDISRRPMLDDTGQLHPDHRSSEPLPDRWPSPCPILPEERIVLPGEGHELFRPGEPAP